jgi:NAD+ kinase
MARVGFISKPDKSVAATLLARLAAWLRADGHVAVVASEDQLTIEGTEIVAESELTSVDVLCVLGGDGTMLRASRVVGDTGIPVLGINLGQLGFLAGFAPDEAEIGLAGALAGTLRVEDRTRLLVTLQRDSGELIERTALNDAVIHQGAVARIVDVDAYIDGDFVASYRADGLIVSTPTGSTAYNMAAGGPILIPGAMGMTLTPICAHSLTNRPLIAPPASTIRFTLAREARGVILTVDGQWGHSFFPGEEIRITTARHPLRLFAGPKNYFDVMRDKLHWGMRGVR